MSNNRRNNQSGNRYNLNPVSSNGNQGYLRNDKKTQIKNNQNKKNLQYELNKLKKEIELKNDEYNKLKTKKIEIEKKYNQSLKEINELQKKIENYKNIQKEQERINKEIIKLEKEKEDFEEMKNVYYGQNSLNSCSYVNNQIQNSSNMYSNSNDYYSNGDKNKYYFSYQSYNQYNSYNRDYSILNFIKQGKSDNYKNYMNQLIKVKGKGLINLGNCCYLNALLQCFFYIPELTINFIKEYEKNPRLRNSEFSSGYYDFITTYLSSNCDSFPPQKFKDALINSNSIFSSSNGHDSKDVLFEIINNLQNELLDNNNGEELDLGSVDPKNESEAYTFCIKEYKQDFNLISEIFNWIHKTEKYCKNCKTKFYDFINDNLFIFNLRTIYETLNKRSNESINLINCFKFFRDSEKESSFYCLNCEDEMDGIIEHKLCSLPNIIIIFLERDKNDPNYNIKIDEEIDLREFYDIKYNYPAIGSTIYTLIGVTILYSFHTIALCKHFNGNYYLFNDTNCSKSSIKRIKNEVPYLVFYKKKDA